jgi:cytochrome c oxidase subunit II
MRRLAFFPEQASTMAGQVDALFFFLLGVTAFFSLLIAGLIVTFMIRFRRRPGTWPSERSEPTHSLEGSFFLETFWSVVPFLITMVAFFWSARIYADLYLPPEQALQVNVVGKQWMWKFQHLEGRQEIDELHVPVGRPVRLHMTSEDVIHSLFVPAFRTKMDAVPGRYTSLWFEATKPGEYRLYCAEYCGTLHSGMIGRVIALEPTEFEAWLAGIEPGAGRLPVAALGERVYQAQGCPTCHEPRGDSARGPSLAGLAGTAVPLTGGGTVTADDNYLRESIVTPQAKLVAGYPPIMPTYQGLVNEQELMQLIAYIKSLAPARAAAEKR